MIHCESLTEAKQYFTVFIKIFYFEHKVKDFDVLVDMILEKEKSVSDCNVKVKETHNCNENDESDDDEEDFNKDKSKKKISPYYRYFQQVIKEVTQNTKLTKQSNPFYCKSFLNI